MSYASITVILSIIYGFPSVFLYIITIFIIIKHKKHFDSSFFNLYIYDGFMNIFTYFNGFFIQRLPSVTCFDCFLAPFYKSLGDFISLNFVLAMTYHMAYVQYLIASFVSFNRFTSLLKPDRFEPLWKKYTLPLIIFIYLIPFLNTTVVFRYESDMSYFNDTDQYMLFSPKMPVIEVFSILIPFMVLTMTVTIIFNIGSWIILRSLNIQRKEAEKKFLLITFITCIFQLIGTLITVPLTTLKISPLLLNLSLLVPFTSDGLSLIQPWLLMCFSSAMRREVESVFGLKSTSRNMNNVIKIQSVTG